MPPLTLPSVRQGPTLTPAPLRAFWLVASLGIGLTAAASLSVVTRRPAMLGLSVPIAAAVATPGLTNPERVQPVYRRWNGLGRRTADAGTRWTSRVAFAALQATRSLGAPAGMMADPPDRSGWHDRSSQSPGSYRSMDVQLPAAGIIDDPLKRFASKDGNEWAGSLRWTTALLRAIQKDDVEQTTPPANVYTLY